MVVTGGDESSWLQGGAAAVTGGDKSGFWLQGGAGVSGPDASSTDGAPAWQPQFLKEPVRGLPGFGVWVVESHGMVVWVATDLQAAEDWQGLVRAGGRCSEGRGVGL